MKTTHAAAHEEAIHGMGMMIPDVGMMTHGVAPAARRARFVKMSARAMLTSAHGQRAAASAMTDVAPATGMATRTDAVPATDMATKMTDVALVTGMATKMAAVIRGQGAAPRQMIGAAVVALHVAPPLAAIPGMIW